MKVDREVLIKQGVSLIPYLRDQHTDMIRDLIILPRLVHVINGVR